MNTRDKFLAIQNLRRLQRQAGVEHDIAELVAAYGRLLVDAGRPLSFELPPFPSGSAEAAAFNHLQRNNPAHDARLLRFLAAYAGFFRRRDLPVFFNVTTLCRALQVSSRHLHWTIAHARASYRAFDIPKSGGRTRRILAPTGKLREMQGWVLHRILNRCEPHACAHAFVRGRSIVSNARAHVGKQVVVRLDLEDFFPSITLIPVRNVFCRLGYPFSVAHLLAGICTVGQRLPQGAPTSPALSNLVSMRLDRRLLGLARKLEFDYSRYADDLIFSSNNAKLPCLIPFFRNIVEEEGYRLNDAKIRVMRRSARQVVTGIVTNTRPALPRAHLRKLRAALHRLKTQGPSAVDWRSTCGGCGNILQILNGHLALVKMVDPDRARLLGQDASTRQPPAPHSGTPSP